MRDLREGRPPIVAASTARFSEPRVCGRAEKVGVRKRGNELMALGQSFNLKIDRLVARNG